MGTTSMPGRLKTLLTKDTLARTALDYEAVYDDFIMFAGGWRLCDRIKIPAGVENADYYLERTDYDCVIELKQVQKYLKDDTLDTYFNRLLASGQLSRTFPNVRPGMTVAVGPDSLSPSQWRRFYEKFRPGVLQALKKANDQLKNTDRLIPRTHPRRVMAAILVNTNDFNLSTDLLFRITQRKVALEWKMDKFRSIDLAICCSIDLHRPGRNALHARRIVRSKDDDVIVDAAWFIHDRWIRYVASELGLKVEEVADDGKMIEQEPFEITPGFSGKLRLHNDAA